jgi:hypothetical protein
MLLENETPSVDRTSFGFGAQNILIMQCVNHPKKLHSKAKLVFTNDKDYN